MKDQSKKQKSQKGIITRREFLGTTAASAAAFMIVPRHVLGGPGYTAPSDKLNIGCVGAGGKGKSDITSVSTENIVALCDVDDTQMGKFEEHAKKEAEKHTGALTQRSCASIISGLTLSGSNIVSAGPSICQHSRNSKKLNVLDRVNTDVQ